MPNREWFFGTASAVQNWYDILLHELIHWTGADRRLARTFGKRFVANWLNGLKGDIRAIFTAFSAAAMAAELLGELRYLARLRSAVAEHAARE